MLKFIFAAAVLVCGSSASAQNQVINPFPGETPNYLIYPFPGEQPQPRLCIPAPRRPVWIIRTRYLYVRTIFGQIILQPVLTYDLVWIN